MAGLLVVMHAGFIPRIKIGDVPLEFDSANNAYIATRMLAGEPYLTVFNNKPPGIYWLYEASIRLLGRAPLACKVPTLACDLISLFLMLFIGRRLLPRPGSLLALAIYSTLFLPATIAPHGFSEFPVAMLTLAGIVAILPRKGEASFRFSPPRAFLLGLALGAATLFKQPALFVLAGALLFSIWVAGEARWRAVWLILAGWAVPVSLLLVWLATGGSLAKFWHAVVMSGPVFGYARAFPWSVRSARMAEATLVQMPLFSVAALLLLVRAAVRRNSFDRFVLCFALPVMGMGVLAYEFYGHYLLPALPILCLGIAGRALEGRRVERAAAGVLLVSQVVILLGTLVGARVPADPADPVGGVVAAWKEAWPPRPLTLGYQLRAADYVRGSLRPGEKLVSTNTDIPFLAGIENSYRFFCIAPFIRTVSGNDLADFPEAAARARFFWAEKWRLELLPAEFVSRLSSGEGWRRIEALDHDEFALYENLAPEGG